MLIPELWQWHPFDALVFVPNCDKIVPGMLMAALRLNMTQYFCQRRAYDAGV